MVMEVKMKSLLLTKGVSIFCQCKIALAKKQTLHSFGHEINMCFPLLGLTPSGLFMGLSSTIIYTSELILCSTICVPSATRHNIYMYPCFLLAAIHHLKSSPTFSVRPCSSVGRVTEDSNPEVVGSIPNEVKRFFLCLVWFPVSLY